MTVNCKQIIGTYTLFCGRIKTIIRKLEDRMSRRRKGHGCGITVLVLLFIFILAGGGLGVLFAKKYMPSNELADKSRVFGIKGEIGRAHV